MHTIRKYVCTCTQVSTYVASVSLTRRTWRTVRLKLQTRKDAFISRGNDLRVARKATIKRKLCPSFAISAHLTCLIIDEAVEIRSRVSTRNVRCDKYRVPTHDIPRYDGRTSVNGYRCWYTGQERNKPDIFDRVTSVRGKHGKRVTSPFCYTRRA